jgi:hypothetical protein
VCLYVRIINNYASIFAYGYGYIRRTYYFTESKSGLFRHPYYIAKHRIFHTTLLNIQFIMYMLLMSTVVGFNQTATNKTAHQNKTIY